MNTAKTITLAILSVFSMFWGNSQATGAEPANTPNILWISCEDISPHISCFGDPHAITPNIDQLAREGVRYTNCFTTAGVCAPCRSGCVAWLRRHRRGERGGGSHSEYPTREAREEGATGATGCRHENSGHPARQGHPQDQSSQ